MALGEGVTVGVGLGVAVGEAVGLGVGFVAGLLNAPPSTRAAEITTIAAIITPNMMRFFWFLALVCGLFLPHSGFSVFFRNLRERGMPN
jgi:hypothetical protein